MPVPRVLRRWRELLLVLVSSIVSLVIAEVAFRLYLRSHARSDFERVERQLSVTHVDTRDLGDIVRLSTTPDLFYELKPNLDGRFFGGTISTNALGMRMSIEPALEKPAGVIRVVALGDSYLFGQGVNDGENFVDVLQARALAEGKPVELLNFGVPGYNTWMEGVVLATRARYFAPDVILVAVTGNDWDLPTFMLSRPYGDVAHSFLLGALAERWRPAPTLLSTPKSRVYEDHYLAVPSEVPDGFRHMVGFQGYRRALLGMLEVAIKLGAKIVLFSDCVSPTGPGTVSCTFPFAAGEYELLRKEVYEHPGVVVCPWQLPPALLIPHDGHPNAGGHRSLTEQLLVCLRANGVLLL